MLAVHESEPPDLYKKWVAISVIAACMKRKCRLDWGLMTVYPNMYIVLVGPSGCRKGTAMSPGLGLLRQLGINLAAESITREALIQELERSAEETITEDGRPMIHSSLTVFSPELTVFLGYSNQQLMADLSDWYDCHPIWIYRTKGSGVNEITNIWVNIIGATTPDLLQSTLPRDAIGGGLTSRIIFVYETKKGKICPTPFLTPEEERLFVLLKEDLEAIKLMHGRFTVDEDFIEFYVNWYIEQENNAPMKNPVFDGYMSRRAGHILKLCQIMKASKPGKDPSKHMVIGVDIIKDAIDLLIETEKKMVYTFTGVGDSPIAQILPKIMISISSHGEILVSELMRIYYNDVDSDTMQKIIATLHKMNFCRHEKREEGWTLVYNKDQKDSPISM